MTYPNTVISMPSQLFTMRSSFKAVANGSVYIGEVDTDPTIPTNQIQVYIEQENGTLVPVAQPIKINSAGLLTASGQVQKFVLTNTEYSMTVQNSYGVDEFYFPRVYDQGISAALEVEDRMLGVGGEVYRGKNGQYVENGDIIPTKIPPYTHLTIPINGKTETVAMSPIASGVVADLTETGATIGGVSCKFGFTLVGVIDITEDTIIDNTVDLVIKNGGGFNISSGVTLTIDAEIQAGYYQIFFGDGEALPTYLKTDTPQENRSKTEKVKAAWFGVVGDAFVPGNYGSSLPTAALGDVPTGTDSTDAFKKAMKFVEWGSMHGSKYLVQRSRMTLVGTPNTAILVKGDGIFKQQAFATEIAAVYALADAGSAFLASTEFQTAKFSDWQFSIDMQDGHIFWQPLTATDEFISAEYMLNRCEFRRMRMTPCGITAGQMGVFFHNRSATYYDGLGNVVEWHNSLGWPTFEDCEIAFGELAPPQLGTYDSEVGIDKLFRFSGFGRGDRLNLNRFISNQFKTGIRCENSQAVEMNIDSSCELRSQITGAIWFDFASFAGQFRCEGSGIFVKGSGQTVLRTAIEDNKSDFTDSAEFSISNIRMEGGANRHTLIDVEAGRINLEGFTHNYAMSNTTEVNACDMRISGTAEVFAKSAGIPGVILFDEYDSGKIKSVPALTADGVRFSGSDGLDNVSYIIGGVTKSMSRAIAQGNEIPWVSLSNTPTILGADVIESPASYGGRNAKGGKTREVTLTASDYSVNGETFYLPSWCVVESMKVTRRSTDITQFAKVRTTVNTTGTAITNDYTFPSNDGEYLAEMLPDTTFLTVPTSDKAKRQLNFTVLDASDQGVSGGPLMSVTIKYRSLMTWSECPNSGLQSNPEFITL